MLKYFVAAAALLVLAGCGGVDPNSPEGKRKAAFKQMLNLSEDMGGMLRGRLKFDEQQFAEKAALLDDVSRQPWQYFETASDSKTAAKDDIWQQKERFLQLARELENTTVVLRESAKQQPANTDTLGVRIDQVEKACESCHQAFRIY
ncbi:MAG: cytochrome c [Thiopseudomonas sp.]|nr:cytochrome c [Thiopseudomonas sp.]